MLRKTCHIVIILLLLVSTSGLAVTRHYCGEVQKSVSIYSTPKSCCGDKCDKCHNIFKFTKVNDDFVSGASISTPTLTENFVFHTVFSIDFSSFNTIPPLSGIFYNRAGNNSKAGCIPAFLGSFRC